MFNKLSREVEDMKKTQDKFLEMKITMSEMKNTLDGITSNLDTAEEEISECEDNSNRNDLKWNRERKESQK